MSQKGSSPAKPDGLTYLSEQRRPRQNTVCRRYGRLHGLQSTTGLRWINGASSGPAQEKIMLLAIKLRWTGIAVTLLMAAMLVQGFTRSAAGSDSNKEGVAAFVVKSEIKKMQETLRNKGHFQSQVDGVFGLRTRASIRAYQKAENLPVTGEVDARTADGLGVRPESTWGNPKNAGREVGPRDKPSAGIQWTKGSGRTSKALRKAVARATVAEDNQNANKQQAENEKHDP